MTSPEEPAPDLVTTPLHPRFVRGALDVERTAYGLLPHRLPGWARQQAPDAYLLMSEAQPSGVRLAFRSRATVVELDVLPTKVVYKDAPAGADGVYDLLVDGRLTAHASVPGGRLQTVDMTADTLDTTPGPPGTARFTGLPDRAKDIEIWLPQAETTELGALRTDAPVEPATDHGRRVWLHHGSSISHGPQADSPTRIWPALAAARAGVELVNLGFGGNALLDPFTARAIRDCPADLISLKIGINLVNTDLMRLRGFVPAVHGFLDTIREGHPTTPLLVVSPILCPVVEDTPGPTAPDLDASTPRLLTFGDPADVAHGHLTLNVIRDTLARITTARATTDPHLHYLDGRLLYGPQDFADLPLPDLLHPDTPGHHRIATHFTHHAFTPPGPFHAPPG